MPAYTQTTSPPSPDAGAGIKTGMPEVKMAHFAVQPVTGMYRPPNYHEHWALYNFECHSRSCPFCHEPLKTYKRGDPLCQFGTQLAKEVNALIDSKDAPTKVFARGHDDEQLDIPNGFEHSMKLLCALERLERLEREERHFSRRRERKDKPLVSYDENYEVPPRTPSTKTFHSNKGFGRSKTYKTYASGPQDLPQVYKVVYRSLPSRRDSHADGSFEPWR